MMHGVRPAHRPLVLLVGPALLYVLGCSAHDGLGRRYPASGTVKYKGEPIAKGLINLVPVKGGATHGSSGIIEDGSFSLSTLTPGDGALPGEYKVVVNTRQVDEDRVKAEAAKIAAKHGIVNRTQTPPILVARAAAKSMKKAKGTTPAKYQSPQTSDLTAQVGEKRNYFTFELND